MDLILLTINNILAIINFITCFRSGTALGLTNFFCNVPVLLKKLTLQTTRLRPMPCARPATPRILGLQRARTAPARGRIQRSIAHCHCKRRTRLSITLRGLNLDPSNSRYPRLDNVHRVRVSNACTLMLRFSSPAIPFSA